MMENLERMEAGISQLARTRTSRVPRARVRICNSRIWFLPYRLEPRRSSVWDRNGW